MNIFATNTQNILTYSKQENVNIHSIKKISQDNFEHVYKHEN